MCAYFVESPGFWNLKLCNGVSLTHEEMESFLVKHKTIEF